MKDCFLDRRDRLQQALKEQNISAAIFDDRLDQYYFSGTMQSNYLFIPAYGEPFHLARKAKERLERESPALDLYIFRNTQEILAVLKERELLDSSRMALNFETTTMSNGERWRRMLPEVEWVDIGGFLRSMRRVKTDQELALLRKSGEVLCSVPEWAEEAFRKGYRTELEIAAVIEGHLRLAGHGGVVRLSRAETETVIGLVVAGESANGGSRFEGVCAGNGLGPAVPFGPSGKAISSGEPIELDYVMNYQGYHVDQTRMMTWGSEPTDDEKRAYHDMLSILLRLEEHLRPGVLPEELYKLAEEMAARRGWSSCFMGYGGEKVYFVGHGIGLTLDEEPFIAPRYRVPLEPGMVIALEPKVMMPGVGVVGIEDTYIVTEHGAERITLADRRWRVIK